MIFTTGHHTVPMESLLADPASQSHTQRNLLGMPPSCHQVSLVNLLSSVCNNYFLPFSTPCKPPTSFSLSADDFVPDILKEVEANTLALAVWNRRMLFLSSCPTTQRGLSFHWLSLSPLQSLSPGSFHQHLNML